MAYKSDTDHPGIQAETPNRMIHVHSHPSINPRELPQTRPVWSTTCAHPHIPMAPQWRNGWTPIGFD